MNNVNVIEHRYLGSIKLIDVTTRSVIQAPMILQSENVQLFQNKSGLYVIKNAAGLENHITQFASVPQAPEAESLSFDIAVIDPAKKYLPRQLTISLPRSENNEDDNNVMTPINVNMFSATTAKLSSNWSVIRASIAQSLEDENSRPLQGALLRVVRTEDDELLAQSLSDQRGEALIIVSGISSINELDENDNAGTQVRVEVIAEPQNELQMTWPVNPDELNLQAANWIRNNDEPTLIQLQTARTETVAISVAVPGDN